MRKSSVEKMICVPLGSEFDIKCPTGQPRILILSHSYCPTFIRLSESTYGMVKRQVLNLHITVC